jgi:hypothetical protein
MCIYYGCWCHGDGGRRSAAVFFVPSGRESEYQFSTPGGLATIAEQAQCRRLLAVRCNRPHEFPAMDQLQAGPTQWHHVMTIALC